MPRIRRTCCLLTVCVSMITGQAAFGVVLEPEDRVKDEEILPFLPIFTEQDPLQEPVALIRQRSWKPARQVLEALLDEMPERAEVWEVDGFLKIVEHDLAGADASLRKAIELDPKSASAMSKLGHVELTRGRIEEAKRLFEQALSIEAEEPLANLYLGRLAARSGDFEGAVEHYETATSDVDGNFTIAQAELAGLYNRLGRYEATIELLTPLATTGTNDAAVFLLLANAYLEHGDTQSAKRQLSMAKGVNPNHPRLVTLDAQIDRQEGDVQASIVKLREVLRRAPNDHYARYELGRSLLESGDWRGAIIEFEVAAAHLEDPYPIQLQIAEIRLRAGDTEQAIADLERVRTRRSAPRVLQLLAEAYARAGDIASSLLTADDLVTQFPDHMPGYLIAIDLEERAGKFDEAVATAQRAVKRFPQWSPAWIAYSGLYLNAGRYESAKAVISEALRHLPGNMELKFQLASTHQQLGETAPAERLYRELLRDNESSAAILNNLSNLIAEDPGRSKEALELARRAHELAPDSAAVEDTLGWALHQNGENEEAVSWLQSALEKNPADGDVLCRLGIVYSSLGRIERARQTIERCLVMSPEAKLRGQAQAVLNKL